MGFGCIGDVEDRNGSEGIGDYKMYIYKFILLFVCLMFDVLKVWIGIGNEV